MSIIIISEPLQAEITIQDKKFNGQNIVIKKIDQLTGRIG